MAELDNGTTILEELRELNRLLQGITELMGVVAIQSLRTYDLLFLLNLGISGDPNYSAEKILEAHSVHASGGYLGPSPALIPEEDEVD